MKVDMREQAVTSRLKRTSQLRRLGLSLGKATLHPKDHKTETGKGPVKRVSKNTSKKRKRK